jgi:hypothetical protein
MALRRLRRVSGHLLEPSRAAAPDGSEELVLTLGSGQVSTSSGKLGQLRASAASLSSRELRARFDADGYLYLPSLIPSDRVEAAYAEARGELEASGTWPGGRFSAAWRSHGDVMRVAEAPELAAAFSALMGGVEVASYPFKWLRTGQPGDGTGFHVDNVYMNRGSTNLTTAWIPLMDVPYELGGLCVLEGSHALPGFDRFRRTYGEHDWSSWVRAHLSLPPCVGRSPCLTDASALLCAPGGAAQDNEVIGHSGIYSPDPQHMLTAFDPDCRFLTAEFKAGDVLLLQMFTVHGALANTSQDTTRLNIDCRWQPKHEGFDARYLTGGDEPFPGTVLYTSRAPATNLLPSPSPPPQRCLSSS